MPTLDAVFNLMANLSRQNTVTYVEMKTVRKKTSNFSLAARVVDLIDRHDFRSRVVVISFNLAAIAAVKELDPTIRTGALFGPRQWAIKSVRKIISGALDSGANEILLHHLIAKPRILTLALDAELTPIVWTVDDPAWLSRARENRIHAIMTNNPRKCCRTCEPRCKG